MVDIEPVRTLGEHKVRVRLTVDLIPTIAVIVHREGESPNQPSEGTVPSQTAPAAEPAIAVQEEAAESEA